MHKRLTLIAPAVFFAFSSNAFAWGSIALLGSSTHTKIAAKALSVTDLNAYPDMDINGSLIKEGSTSEDGHEKIHNGGGKLKDWWDGGDGRDTLKGGVLSNYTRLNIHDAYLNLGRMCHLTQDQAVPAHAAHIPHSIVLHLPADGVEKYVGKNHDFGAVPDVAGDKQPYEYYQILQNETKSHLAEWISPVTGKPFWTPSPEASRFPDATLCPIGAYGGGDTFGQAAEADSRAATGLSAREIAARQLGMAAGYTRALIESASRRLPPLVSELSLYPNVIAPGDKMEIAFTALENRTRHVKYSVTVTGKDGAAVAVFAGDAALDKPRPASNFNTGDGNAQPPAPEESLFNNRVSFKWDCTVNGKRLADGTYTVQVQLTDDDGNTVPASVNADDVHGNDTVRQFSVVSMEAPAAPAIAFN
jgi:hypothetical protein